MKTFQERLKVITDKAEDVAFNWYKNAKSDVVFDEPIEVQFNSDMNGLVCYWITAIIDDSFYCCDEDVEDIEELQDCYNAIMDFHELTPYGMCMLATAVSRADYVKKFDAVYEKAMAYLHGLKKDTRLSKAIQLYSYVDEDPWELGFCYDRCDNEAAYVEDRSYERTPLEDFYYEDLVKLADAVKKGKPIKKLPSREELVSKITTFVQRVGDAELTNCGKWHKLSYNGKACVVCDYPLTCGCTLDVLPGDTVFEMYAELKKKHKSIK